MLPIRVRVHRAVADNPRLKISDPWFAVVWTNPDDEALTVQALPGGGELYRPWPGRRQTGKDLEVVHGPANDLSGSTAAHSCATTESRRPRSTERATSQGSSSVCRLRPPSAPRDSSSNEKAGACEAQHQCDETGD